VDLQRSHRRLGARRPALVAELLDAVAPTADLAVIDLRLPDGDGVDLAVALRRRWPDLKVLVLTMHAEDNSVMRALAAGLHGYVLKDADPEAILAAVHQVTAGVLVIGRAPAPAPQPAASHPSSAALLALNTREREILELLASGLATAQVASRLYLATKTILVAPPGGPRAPPAPTPPLPGHQDHPQSAQRNPRQARRRHPRGGDPTRRAAGLGPVTTITPSPTRQTARNMWGCGRGRIPKVHSWGARAGSYGLYTWLRRR